MLQFNWSGMKRTYWFPTWSFQFHDDFWYVELKFLFLQATLYSVEMARSLVDLVNNQTKSSTEELPVEDESC